MLRETDDRTLSIAEVASEAAISRFHFIRQFQALFGETPHQFRIHARLDRAKQLLALSDYSVTDVCMEVGFSSLGSFSDLFARRVGVAPSLYRRQVRSMMPVPGVLPPHLTPGCLTLMAAAFAIFEKQEKRGLSHSKTAGGSNDSPRCERAHEDQADQHHGGRPGQGAAVLHGRLRLREEE